MYELGIRLYSLIVSVASLFNPKAKLWIAGRSEWRARLKEKIAQKNPKQPVAWFHAASLGEFEQGRPVIEAFRERYPDFFILLTFYSPSGYEVRKGYQGADYIGYLPADTARNAHDFVQIVQPEIAFFIKYEFWYHYLRELQKNEVPVLIFAAIFRPEQVFFKWWGGFYRSMLSVFDTILVQNTASQQLLASVENIQKVIVAGDTRFDRVVQLVEQGRELPEIETFVGGVPCLVIGSAWAQDMDVLIPVLNKLRGRMKAIIAPHELNRQEMQAWKERLNAPSLFYSEYKSNGFALPAGSFSYLFIDNIGMLSSLYRYGTMAYIGGSFGKGLHNTLEAATFGMPIFFGNKSYKRFSEAVAMLDLGIATAVADADGLGQAVEYYLDNPSDLRIKSEESRRFVASHIGATAKVLSVVKGLIRD